MIAVTLLPIYFIWFWPPLTAGLLGELHTRGLPPVSQEFDDRVKAAFPIGSSEKLLLGQLHLQGFSTESSKLSAGRRQTAERQEGMFCAFLARISWQTDSDGRLTSIWGDYSFEACV